MGVRRRRFFERHPLTTQDSEPTAWEPGDFDTHAIDADVEYPSVSGGGTRTVGLKVQYPTGLLGPRPLVLISHGGVGSLNGEILFDYLGEFFARSGFVAAQLGHRPTPGCSWLMANSVDCEPHFADRTADVRAVIDRFAAGDVALTGFGGTVVVNAVGHTGHSAGAFTSLAVGGASYPHDELDTYEDSRVIAHAPISPQGYGDFFGATPQTFSTVDIPSLLLLGGDELDTNGPGVFIEENWRLNPWNDGAYSRDADRIAIVIEDQDHLEMGTGGSAEVRDFIATATAAFFAYWLEGAGELCDVGTRANEGLGRDRLVQIARDDTALARCSP